MEKEHVALYCLIDRSFYDSFEHYVSEDSSIKDSLSAFFPQSWNIRRDRLWYSCRPTHAAVVTHGWKLHLSSSLSDADALLAAVLPVLLEHETPFKVALDKRLLGHFNSKQWPRGNAGKFITLYPPDTAKALVLAEQLASVTNSFVGPYILSDRRYPYSKTLFYRYGGFVRQITLDDTGLRRLVIPTSDGGSQDDERTAYFSLPYGVEDPFPQEAGTDEASEYEAMTLHRGRYKIQNVLTFTNAGGVYRAKDGLTGEDVIIKEVRPNVGEYFPGLDCKALLEKEFRLLAAVSDLKIAPRAIEQFDDWEHSFIVEEFIEGVPFTLFCAAQASPILSYGSEDRLIAFYEKFVRIVSAMVDNLDALHTRDIVLGDLSPNNVMIQASDEKVYFIDLEGAYKSDQEQAFNLCTPGFGSAARMAASVADAPTKQDDLFALGAMMQAYLLPVNNLSVQDTEAPKRFLDDLALRVGIPEKVHHLIFDLMSPDPSRRPPLAEVQRTLSDPLLLAGFRAEIPRQGEYVDLEALRSQLVRGIRDTATVERQDRLFPSDPLLFETNPLSLAYGALGVTAVLRTVSPGEEKDFVRWINERRAQVSDVPSNYAIGRAGLALCLSILGDLDAARTELSKALDMPATYADPSFHFGTAGVGIACLTLYVRTADSSFLDHSVDLAHHLLNSSAQGPDDTLCWPSAETTYLGLARGASGIALFFCYIYAATGDDRFLTAATQALKFDLINGERMNDGSLEFRAQISDEPIVYPYWDHGSAGIGACLCRLLALCPQSSLGLYLPDVSKGARKRYSVFPGHARGLTGISTFFLDLYRFTKDEEAKKEAYELARTASMFCVKREGATWFPGDRLLRCSSDVATGAAGYLLLLHRLQTNATSPFLPDELVLAPLNRNLSDAGPVEALA